MTELTASVDHIRWCADEFTRTGEVVDGLCGATSGDTASAVAALEPVFGIVGGGFVQAFAAAHAGHVRSGAGLARVLDASGATADAIARAYAQHEAGQAASFGGQEAVL